MRRIVVTGLVPSPPDKVEASWWRLLASDAQAGISAREVRHLNAHATLTPVGDLAEIDAIRRVFGGDFSIAVSGTKSATAHLLGAAGGLGTIFTILALRDQVGTADAQFERSRSAGDGIDFVAKQGRPLAMDYAISNGFGFGGVNATALFRRWTDKLVKRARDARD